MCGQDFQERNGCRDHYYWLHLHQCCANIAEIDSNSANPEGVELVD